MTDITELAQSLKAAAEKATQGNWRAFQYHDGRCGIGGGHNDEIMVCEHISKERPHDAMFIALANPANILALVEALEEAQQRIAELESRTVKLPDELSGETLLDVASSTDLVYSDDTGVLEYTNINGCFVKVTAPPDKVIRFSSSNKCIYIRLVDRVKAHENAGIIIDFHKNNKDFIQ
ncbi:ead/Ea22-like family protein [Klebsiella phage LASTA]|uniref:Ead/Ea22-like family protein n=2 Tax=Lastavirus lasta TaxID=2845090 RepID=A0A6H0X3E9_9CAUD|nr:ead/Ea22-like family protein [Klebsiella phage LASTA]QIW86675.1 ead/Ea22-like family protein [Klebsiella phage LASTA]QIW86751.1 ead/Ea22-like family protein [Klebsiella phage SJM3]